MSDSKLAYRVGWFRGIPVDITVSWVIIASLITIEFTRGQYSSEIGMVAAQFTKTTVAFETLPVWVKLVFSGTLVCGVYGSVLLHEFGHAIRADANGLVVDRIRLWLLGGIANIDVSDTTAKEEFDIASGGPLVTAGIIIVSGIATIACNGLGMPPLITVWFGLLTIINISVLVFNLLPVFPMDGGRLTRALLQYKYGIVTATNAAVRLAQVASIGLIIFGAFTLNPVYILVAVFVYIAGRSERKKTLNAHKEKRLIDAACKAEKKLQQGKGPITVRNKGLVPLDEDINGVDIVQPVTVDEPLVGEEKPDFLVVEDKEKQMTGEKYANIDTVSTEDYQDSLNGILRVKLGIDTNSESKPKTNQEFDDEISHDTYRYWPDKQ